MQNKAQTVTEYMKEVQGDHLDALTELREICLQNLKGFKEGMDYGVPSYSRDNKIEVSWQSRNNQIIIQFGNPEILKKYKQELKGLEISNNSIRFKKPDHIDYSLITTLIQEIPSQNEQ